MEKSKIYGIIGSGLFSVIVFLLLWFVYMPLLTQPKEEEGIMVSFGFDDDGVGFGDGIEQLEDATQESALSEPETQDLLTQETEQSLQLPKQTTETKNNKKQEDVRLQQERERLRKEALAAEKRQKEAAAALAKQQKEATSKAENLLSGAFGSGGTGSGTTSGETQQGNPAGKGNSGGHGWSLEGRTLIGSLVSPSYGSNEEGKVTVAIRVDKNGNVTNASIGQPTTISDKQLRDTAIETAKKQRFTSGDNIAIGTITYNFKLK